MRNDDFVIVDMVDSSTLSDNVKNKVCKVGVSGLNTEKATELGVFQRVANLLSMVHTCVLTSFSIFDDVDLLLEKTLGAKRHEIKKEMNRMEDAYMQFVKFWNIYYDKDKQQQVVNDSVDSMYHNVFKWMQVPKKWDLGGKQRTEEGTGITLTFDDKKDDKEYTFRVVSTNSEIIQCDESWCVMKLNKDSCTQTSVESCVGMDKASALMSAKRISANDPDGVYTVALIRDVVEKRTDVIPFKSFQNNKTIGKIVKTIKG